MSDNGKTNLVNQLQTSISTLLNLREDNPKVFYGGIAAVVVVFLLIVITPGGKDVESQAFSMNSTYTFSNPNGGNILLTAVPTFSSADYVGEDSINICTVKPGAQGKLIEKRVVNYIPYIRLEVMNGDCQGKKGWTSSVNIKN